MDPTSTLGKEDGQEKKSNSYKKIKAIVIRKLDCVWLYVEASERKGKYEDDEEVNQGTRKKRKTKRKNKGFGFGKLKQQGRKYSE